MAADLFWSNVNTDPKRRYRFAVQLNGQGEAIPIWTVKSTLTWIILLSIPVVLLGTISP